MDVMRPTPARYLKDLLEHTNLIAYLKYADGKYIYVNKMYEAVARTPSRKIIGRTDRDIFPEPIARLFAEQDRQVIESGAPIEFEETIPLADGLLSFITAKFPLHDDAGRVWAVGGVCTNVTGLKKAQEELRQSQERFQALTENSWDGMMIVDKDARILYHTPSIEHILGYKPEEVVGKPIWHFIHKGAPENQIAAIRELLSSPELGGRRELVLRHKDGSLRTVEGVAKNLLANPRIQGIVINYQDVTARRIAEDHLIESERKHRLLVETLSEGIWSFDQDGRTTFINSLMADMLGYRKDEIQGQPIFAFLDQAGAALARSQVASRKQGNTEVFTHDFEFIRKDGTRLSTLVSTAPLWDEAGGYVGATAAVMDITERKRTEEALRRSEAMLAKAEHLAGIGSFDRDIATQKVRHSDGFLRIFGLKPRDTADTTEAFLPYIHEDDRGRIMDAIRKSVAEGAPYREEYRIRRPDGTETTVHAEGEVSKDDAGRPVRFFGWVQDIAERRELEEKVLQISDRERRNIGHDLHDDLGQQLTGIALLGRALQERLSAQSSPEAEAMAVLLRHVDSALVHVRELARGLESAPARPEGLLEALAGLAAHVRSTSQVSCRLEADPSALVRDPSVANQLYRIAQEAVHNAVRHGRPKKIAITLTEDDRGLNLTVADDGAGLLESPKKDAGMGLDIMRHRASLIHGTLTIASQTGKGTEIICRIPAAAPAPGDTA